MRYVIALFISLCASALQADQAPRIQLIGDSLMATNVLIGRAIPQVVETALGEEVDNRAVIGAMIRGVSRQYRQGDFDWVVLNGGGNDLWLGCGCSKCDARMEELISADGMSGQVPDLVGRIRSDGARVIYVGYLRSPGFGSPIEHCRDEGDEFERRIAELARAVDGMWLLSNKDLVPHGDRSFHAFDRIHPSVKGSRVIGQRVAAVIKQLDQY